MQPKRIIPQEHLDEVPPAIRRLAQNGKGVVEWTNPDGSKVYWFLVDDGSGGTVESKGPPLYAPVPKRV